MRLPFTNRFVPAVNDFARLGDWPRAVQFLDFNSLGEYSSDSCMMNTSGPAEDVDEAKSGNVMVSIPLCQAFMKVDPIVP